MTLALIWAQLEEKVEMLFFAVIAASLAWCRCAAARIGARFHISGTSLVICTDYRRIECKNFALEFSGRR